MAVPSNGRQLDIQQTGWSPLNIAASKGHVATVKALIQARANLNQINKNRSTPLYRASLKGHLEVVQMLLDAGADVNLANSDGWSPIHAAADEGVLSVVHALLAAGADFHRSNNVAQRLEAKADVALGANAKSHETTVRALDAAMQLVEAVPRGDESLVRDLLAQGVSSNAVNKDGQAPLHVAVSTEAPQVSCSGLLSERKAVEESMVQLLLNGGVAIDRRQKLRLLYDDPHALLINAGAALDCADNNGDTALHNAAIQSHITALNDIL
ncbi:serine/threonine-protein phosphatase 6 regulatory ankyrin repeat subunit A-like [Achlya hypogyna]|uniref:Serine/threonine-protein phosphatase 6 regulatory ankyrin repeat subunit A-like n=1 Tax=Achlya hypogyna TaxID=1202772 RepID=A0A1V9YU65_ACHHY|nr:serine/threonine-protein phosphatase 6 regulatory ankyrin repeat subunit A-like [Achlya hypogyna]